MTRHPNGDSGPPASPHDPILAKILRIARIREAADANAAVKERSRRIERARQARVRAQQKRRS